MLANRVKETTTSTGTSNLTLAGAVTNFQSFNTVFDNDTDGTAEHFYYFIIDDTNNAWEYGIGYLSASTTLVRAHVLRSTNSDAAVNFSTGTKDVYCDIGEYSTVLSFGKLSANDYRSSAHMASKVATVTVVANYVYYIPFYPGFINDIDALSICFNSVSGSSNCRLGLYDCIDGKPQNLIVQTSTFTPAVGRNDQAITQRNLGNKWYFMAVIGDTADVFRGKGPEHITGNLLNHNENYSIGASYYRELRNSWTDLPTTVGSISAQRNVSLPNVQVQLV